MRKSDADGLYFRRARLKVGQLLEVGGLRGAFAPEPQGQSLKRNQIAMNRKLLAVAVAGVVAPMTAQALDVSVSGQVNRAIRFAGNGTESDVQHIDGSAWGSRLWLTAEGEVMPGINAGAVMEQEFAANRGWQVDVDTEDER